MVYNKSMQVIPFEGRPLTDLLSPYDKAHQDYCYCIIMGMGSHEAARTVNREPQTIRVWRNDDSNFRVLEEYLIENAPRFVGEANTNLISNLSTKKQLFLDDMLERALKWDEQKDVDKRHIMEAVKMVVKLQSSSDKRVPFEEAIFRRYTDASSDN